MCSIKIKWLLFLKFFENLAFFDSYFWLFNKTHEKIIAIFVISAIMASIWNVFIEFRWHDEKLTRLSVAPMQNYLSTAAPTSGSENYGRSHQILSRNYEGVRHSKVKIQEIDGISISDLLILALIYICRFRGFTKFGIKVLWRLQILQ